MFVEEMRYINLNPKLVAKNIEETSDIGRKQIEQPNLFLDEIE